MGGDLTWQLVEVIGELNRAAKGAERLRDGTTALDRDQSATGRPER